MSANKYVRYTGLERHHDSDEVLNRSIAADAGDILEVSPECAKRLLKLDAWEEMERIATRDARGREFARYEPKSKAKPAAGGGGGTEDPNKQKQE